MKTFIIILITLLNYSYNEKRTTNEVNETTKNNNVEIQPIAFGKITTITDGFDVKKVNIWSPTNTGRKVLA